MTLRAQLAEQSSTLLDLHPRIKELKAQIADLDAQIRSEAEKLARSLENDARIAGARAETLAANFDQLKRQAASTNEKDIELRALEREAKAQRDLLESYLAKYREATARDSLNTMPSDVRIISRAAVSNTPHFPKKLPIVLIATLATLFIAVGAITTGELLAGQGHTDAATRVEPAVAGEAPAQAVAPEAEPAGTQAAAPLEAASGDEPAPVAPPAAPVARNPAAPHNSVAEIAWRLREADAGDRRVVVVGASRNVGTTLTAIALARSLAEASRVVLVDLALRAPNLAAFAIDRAGPGVTDLVRGAASFGQIITRDRDSRVHIVPAGRIAADNAAILASDRLQIALAALGQAYDHVVIDGGAAGEAIEPIGRTAKRAVLVATGVAADAVAAAGDRLIASGFTDITVFAGVPPQPNSNHSTAQAAA